MKVSPARCRWLMIIDEAGPEPEASATPYLDCSKAAIPA
jgi:hypothetical protein